MDKREEEYTAFKSSVLKLNSRREHKITGSLGVYDAYKYIRKHKWMDVPRPLTEHEFYSIVRRVSSYLAKELIEGNDVILPCRMGKLEVRKYAPNIKFQDGKLATTLPVNWDATLKLWFEDKESYDGKVLIYEEPKEIFRVLYNVYDANYNNKSFYEFKINRDIKQGLKNKIKEGALEAFIIR